MSKLGLDWYKREPAAYLKDVQGMSRNEHAVYSIVLDLIYFHGGAIKNDPKFVAGYVSDMGGALVRKTILALVERGILTLENDLISQKRAQKEVKTKEKLREKSEKNGKIGGKASGISRATTKENNSLDEASGSTTGEAEKIREDIPPNPPRVVDLFSTDDEPEREAERSDEIDAGFSAFWDDIWPKHKRKTGKADCFRVYRAACTGKHPKSGKIAPDVLNEATAAYIASLGGDHTFLKGTLSWLRQPGWEPFLENSKSRSVDELSKVQRTALSDGRVPPSMQVDGKPTQDAAYWLEQFGHEVRA